MEHEYISFYESYAPLYGKKTAIFMMVGSFYELYDILDPHTGLGKTSCKDAVETMGITLTTKKSDSTPENACRVLSLPSAQVDKPSTLFAGFPEYALHKWASKLTSLGWTVVIVDQIKDSSGRVVNRKASSILSPGTHVEAASTDAVYLCGLLLTHIEERPPEFGAASIDLTTGKTTSYQGQAQGRQDEWVADTLMHFFQVHTPKELVIWFQGPSILKPQEDSIRRVLSLNPLTSIHIRDAAKFNQLQTEQIFERIFKPRTLLPILTWLTLPSYSCHAASTLLHLVNFVEDHLPSSLDILQTHNSWKPQEHVFVGNNAFTQLQFISSRSDESVLGIFNRCFTPMGKRAIRERLLIPITNQVILKERYDSIELIQKKPAHERKALEAALRAMYDIPRLHRKIQCISPTAQDIMALYQSYEAAKDIWLLNPTTKPPLEIIESLIKNLVNSFSIEKAQTDSEDLCFLNNSFIKTKAQEDLLKSYQVEADDIIKKLQVWAGLRTDSLKLEWRESMCGIRGSKTSLQTIKMKYPTHKELCPLKEIGDITIQKSGGWIEAPFFKTHFYRVLSARAKLKEAFLEELPLACMKYAEATQEYWELLENWISEIDMISCFARVAEERGFSRPILTASGESSLDIRGLRHPLIESIQTRSEYVKHDVALNNACKGWLVYGMNASGKSSLMKAIGIATLLAQAGSFVPATYMSFTPFQSILTRILNQDNLWAGLSSFTVEMSELREILRRADQNSLVLGDELCSGTESVSATALVAAGIQTLLGSGSKFLFATHFHGLMNVFEDLPVGLAVWHLRVKYDPITEKLIYQRNLQPGPGSTLYGLEVARAMDMPKDFLALATTYRRGLVGSANEEEAPASKWNKEIRRRFCEVCGKDVVRDLEVHHIRERNEAVRGKFADGTSMNHVRNLVVLCELCHDKHHAGQLQIGDLKQTSQGLEREVKRVTLSANAGNAGNAGNAADAGNAVEEETAVNPEDDVKQYLRDHPSMPLKTVSFFLKQKGIKFTSQRLASIRKKL